MYDLYCCFLALLAGPLVQLTGSNHALILVLIPIDRMLSGFSMGGAHQIFVENFDPSNLYPPQAGKTFLIIPILPHTLLFKDPLRLR